MSDSNSSALPSEGLKGPSYNRRRAAEERLKAEKADDLRHRAMHLAIADIFDERADADDRRLGFHLP